jgi:uncharacterized RDD family membrane protein YckC
MSSMTGGVAAPRATFGQRFIALLVDELIFGVVAGVLEFVSPVVAGLVGLLFIAYYIVMVGRGQTYGDQIAGIRIVDANGNAPGYGKATIRLIMQGILGSIFLLTYLWVLWDADKQTLHDKIAGTITIVAK